MRKTYKSPADKSFRRIAIIGSIAVIAFWIYSIAGGGMTEKDVVCTHGGQAYGMVLNKLWRQEQFDYVCKK